MATRGGHSRRPRRTRVLVAPVRRSSCPRSRWRARSSARCSASSRVPGRSARASTRPARCCASAAPATRPRSTRSDPRTIMAFAAAVPGRCASPSTPAAHWGRRLRDESRPRHDDRHRLLRPLVAGREPRAAAPLNLTRVAYNQRSEPRRSATSPGLASAGAPAATRSDAASPAAGQRLRRDVERAPRGAAPDHPRRAGRDAGQR